jgi:glucose-6-phosphate isomerase
MRFADSNLGITVDIDRMGSVDFGLERWGSAFSFMDHLEAGAVANPDEGRQVGHYWLRTPSIAPMGLGAGITASWDRLARLAAEVHEQGFRYLLMVGIGGSALGPQLLMDALGTGSDKMEVLFLDNTDPEGMDRVFAQIVPKLTLVAVLSKSGGTKETRNGMLEVRSYLESHGLNFSSRAIAVTVEGSKLDGLAVSENWLAMLPLWDWVGGRTSVTGIVGLLPLALAGLDWRGFLQGASDMDEATRQPAPENPALLLAASWDAAGDGTGRRAMVVLPYKDRLLLFSRYLQQLVMESLGKRHDMEGRLVEQGLTVYGNKGSTDQHALVQQLREGPDDFFATFIGVLRDREGISMEVEPGVASGDHLIGNLIGTRNALTEAGRRSMTLTLSRVDAYSLGALIALYERAVGLYAAHIGINAYNQPGVEAGKKAADSALRLQADILAGREFSESDDSWLLRAHLQANDRF